MLNPIAMKGIIIVLCFITFNVAKAQFKLENVIHTQTQEVLEESNQENSTEVISSEQIEELKANSIDDLLQNNVEATTARGPRSSAQSIQVRGLDSNKVFIMVDGVRQNYREGHSAMNPVDIENLKAVEIHTSSSDFSKGNSLGGGVQFITKDATDILKKDKKVGSEFKLLQSSANTESRYNAKTAFRNENVSGYLSLTSAKAKNLKLNDGTELNNSSYEDFSGLFKLNYKDSGLSFERYQRNDNNPLDPSLNPPSDLKSLLADSLLLKNTLLVTHENKKNDFKLYLNQYETNKVNREDSVSEIRKIETTGLNYVRNYKTFKFGTEIFKDELDSRINSQQINSYPKANSINTSLFAQKEWTIDSYKISPGIKYIQYSLKSEDFEDKFDSKILKKLYQQYNLNELSFVYFDYSEGLNAPKVTEVYPSGLHSPGDDFFIKDNFFVTNLDLNHETSVNKEVGIKLEKSFSYLDRLVFKTSIYENNIQDYIKIERIDKSVIDEGNGTSQFINLNNVNLKGVEAKINYSYDIYDFGISYSSIRGKNIDDDLFLEDLPADQYVYTFKVFLEKYNASLGYSGVNALDQNRVNPQTIQRTEATPGYFIHNVFANVTLDNSVDLGVRVNNLGNTKYRRHASHINESEQDIRLFFKYRINTL